MQKVQPHPPLWAPQPTLDPQTQQDIQRLYRLTVYGRWLVVLLFWLTIGAFSLWQLRYRIAILLDYFTWAAVRYGLAYHLTAALGLSLCIGLTAAVLTWQSRNRLFGLPEIEKQRLQQQALRIRQQGKSHPLWRWVCEEKRR
jgi:hypothetical protein